LSLGKDHTRVKLTYLIIADVYETQGEFEKALEACTKNEFKLEDPRGDLPHRHFVGGDRAPNWYPGFIPKDPYGCMEFTSEVSIVPDTFPYAACYGEACQGVLL
jgi:hypothetical protein